MENFETSGLYFDGLSANSKQVPVYISEDGIEFILEGQEVFWEMEQLRSLDDQARDSGIILETLEDNEARLILEDRAAATFIRSLPNTLTKRTVSSAMKRKVAFWGAGAVASVLLILFVIIPALANTLARYIPVEREVALGEYSMKQIEWLVGEKGQEISCSSPEGDKALAKMVERLSDHFENPYPSKVQVFDIEMTNAFAVPGGQVVLFDGLIQAATSPEEVAGVLAHEFGHVINRDPTRLSLRSAGSAGILGMVFGDFAGGFAALAMAEAVLSASYSQDAETDADAFSHELFAKAKLPSARFGNFFTTLAKDLGEEDEDGLLSHVASHPDLASRADAAKAADVIGDGTFEPILNEDQWNALRAICN